MDYELAKELKDAGYEMDYELDNFSEYDKRKSNIYLDLGELIEACGDGFDSLDRLKDYKTGETYSWGTNLYKTTGGIKTYTTPEEAVAKLWLAINKK